MKENKGLACLGMVVLLVVSLVVSALMDGWALSVLWGWFIVPFFGAPILSIPYAIGLGLVASMLLPQSSDSYTKKDDLAELIGKLIGRVLVFPILTVIIGWVVFMVIK